MNSSLSVCIYIGKLSSVIYVVSEGLFPLCRLIICPIDDVLCLREAVKFHKVPFDDH